MPPVGPSSPRPVQRPNCLGGKGEATPEPWAGAALASAKLIPFNCFAAETKAFSIDNIVSVDRFACSAAIFHSD